MLITPTRHASYLRPVLDHFFTSPSQPPINPIIDKTDHETQHNAKTENRRCWMGIERLSFKKKILCIANQHKKLVVRRNENLF